MSHGLPAETRGLVKRQGEIVAVDDVDLSVEPGDVSGYLGTTGARKTTAMRILLGLPRPDAGTARLFGHDPQQDPHEALDGVRRLHRDTALLSAGAGVGSR